MPFFLSIMAARFNAMYIDMIEEVFDHPRIHNTF
jgi:hypothetical protein